MDDIKRFWLSWGQSLPKEALVFDCGTLKLPLMNCLGRVIFHTAMAENRLIFVDLVPDANWAHPCAYCFITPTGVVWRDEKWPPSSDVPMTPIERP